MREQGAAMLSRNALTHDRALSTQEKMLKHAKPKVTVLYLSTTSNNILWLYITQQSSHWSSIFLQHNHVGRCTQEAVNHLLC
jgi:hypothetical protein